MKRYEVYKQFQEFVQKKDDRDMDAICASNGEFQLQAQQLFLREYMKAYPEWRRLVLYHEIGSGKTCTAITMAEEYLATHPGHKVKVILPARLKTNFIDELISPCGMEAYISREDLARLVSPKTTTKVKTQIKKKFMTALNKRYDIMSFEKFKITGMKRKHDLFAWVEEFTQDSMIIVDEVHNLLSSTYDNKRASEILSDGQVERSFKGMNTIMFKLLTTHAHTSCKIVMLTATPIFDNIAQMRELVMAVNPTMKGLSFDTTIKDVIEHLRGKVSYFPGTSVNAYPMVDYITHDIVMSETQDDLIYQVLEEDVDKTDEFKEEFMAVQRQVSIACYKRRKSVSKNIKAVIENIPEYCPKIEKLLEVINNNPGKHVVYSNFVQSGLRVVEAVLKKAGWRSWNDAEGAAKHKVYALWDGSVKDADKQMIKSIVNARDNIFGEKIRVILGSPSVKEGVSFKHIQHIHLLDPVWNQSAKTQVEGRAIRYCSHVDIDPVRHAPLKRQVMVNIYKLMPRPDGLVKRTCDQTIYEEIIERKKRLISAGERALKKVAIDHYLFRNMYADKKHNTPKSADSHIDLGPDGDIYLFKKNNDRKRNTCPKKRRPDKVSGVCPSGMIKKQNKQGDDCCYVERKGRPTKTPSDPALSKCAKPRRPVDGACPEGFYLKDNKHGVPCCFKKRAKKT